MPQRTRKIMESFFAKGSHHLFQKGTTIIRADDLEFLIYYLKQGLVKQYSISENGEELTFHIFKPGTFFPIILALANKPNKYYFEAINEVVAYAYPKETVLSLLKQDNKLLYDLSIRLSTGLVGLLTKIESMMFEQAYERVASFIYYFAQKFGQKSENAISIPFSITHADLASWLGMQRETVSRQLAKLEGKGVIKTEKRHISVIDLKKLKQELKPLH